MANERVRGRETREQEASRPVYKTTKESLSDCASPGRLVFGLARRRGSGEGVTRWPRSVERKTSRENYGEKTMNGCL